ncbi:RluA family pseudouridine synthase [Telluribacter sp. SYSU D00476]|uniref:RluA family pseudouridine synthase n=1 Tax=Telluribacter sp. SYSU D00476 TaxID=2811430 RepID=UPI001FF31CF5|nr:RluA family pseudouridine synthase [Telluribacter sp. SYSU D00476]
MKINFSDIILFENDDFLLVNKPPHLATLDERTADRGGSVLRLAREYHPDLQAAHRLDKETSGVLAFAKHPEAYRHLSMQFEHREVTKRYHAVTNGIHDLDSISVYLPILPLKNGTAVKIDKVNGKIAETIFNTLKVYRGYTLVECIPITGRMHQIRIHLSCLNAPIVNDPQYGGKPIYLSSIKRKFNLKKETEEQPLIQRVALHAFALSFALMDGEPIRIEAPYPKDFDVLVKQLDKFGV